MCSEKADAWNDSAVAFVCSEKKKGVAERWKSTGPAVSIWADWCSRGRPVLLYQCFAHFYEGRSREPGWGEGAGVEVWLHACSKESSFSCGSGE